MDTPPLPRRKTIRLQNYDYSQNGAYFVTICTAHKRPLFGVVRRGDPCGRPPVPVYAELSEIGRIVESYLTEIPSHYPDVHLASYVIMPDHIHMILVLTQNQPERAGQCPAPTEESDLSCRRGGTPGPPATTEKPAPPRRRGGTPGPPALPKIINAFKSLTTRKAGCSLWQRGYYEHILRNQQDFDEAAGYITGNPVRRLKQEGFCEEENRHWGGHSHCLAGGRRPVVHPASEFLGGYRP